MEQKRIKIVNTTGKVLDTQVLFDGKSIPMVQSVKISEINTEPAYVTATITFEGVELDIVAEVPEDTPIPSTL